MARGDGRARKKRKDNARRNPFPAVRSVLVPNDVRTYLHWVFCPCAPSALRALVVCSNFDSSAGADVLINLDT